MFWVSYNSSIIAVATDIWSAYGKDNMTCYDMWFENVKKCYYDCSSPIIVLKQHY